MQKDSQKLKVPHPDELSQQQKSSSAAHGQLNSDLNSTMFNQGNIEPEIDEAVYLRDKILRNIKMFKMEYPEFQMFSNRQIIQVFKVYNKEIKRGYIKISDPTLFLMGSLLLVMGYLGIISIYYLLERLEDPEIEGEPLSKLWINYFIGVFSSASLIALTDLNWNMVRTSGEKKKHIYNLIVICQVRMSSSFMVGMVSVSASVGRVSNMNAFVIGIVGAILFLNMRSFLN